jgi:hypothetical protein
MVYEFMNINFADTHRENTSLPLSLPLHIYIYYMYHNILLNHIYCIKEVVVLGSYLRLGVA